MTTITTKSAEETQRLGKDLGRVLKQGTVICLYGDLGAGKTTFVQGLAAGLGIKSRITSPTFIIVRRYRYLWHIDLYRLNNLEEAEAIGIPEILADKNSIAVIEWPEKIEKILPEKRWTVKLQAIGDEKRRIEIIH